MAKCTIIFADKPGSIIGTAVEFSPPLKKNKKQTKAQQLALAVLDMLANNGVMKNARATGGGETVQLTDADGEETES